MDDDEDGKDNDHGDDELNEDFQEFFDNIEYELEYN